MGNKQKKETTATQAEESLTQEQAAVVETQATPTEQAGETVEEEPAEASPATETKAKPAKKKAEALPDFLAPYLRAYPKNKTFHVTSDRMVFLADARSMAVMHQKGLGTGEVTTYKV